MVGVFHDYWMLIMPEVLPVQDVYYVAVLGFLALKADLDIMKL